MDLIDIKPTITKSMEVSNAQNDYDEKPWSSSAIKITKTLT
jgi:hypothetical protein